MATKNQKVRVKPGQEFRHVIADCNALWKVIKRESPGVWLAEVVDEPIEINGETYPSDFAGKQDAFIEGDILRALNLASFFAERRSEHDEFYASLSEGDTVHYHDGFAKFVRCTVDSTKQLVPRALVGAWREFDRPRRLADGRVVEGYQSQKIREGRSFQPNASNVFESPNYGGRTDVDPTELDPIDLTVPEPTLEGRRLIRLHKAADDIRGLLDEATQDDPQALIDALREVRDVVDETYDALEVEA